MCGAKTLLSGQILDRTNTESGISTRKTPKRVSDYIDPATATDYFIVSSSYDEYGAFKPEEDYRNYSGYPVKIDMPADGKSGEVTITGICNLNKYEEFSYLPIKGEYDAEASTITIATPFDSRTANKCLKAATYTRGENEFTAVIAGCKVGDAPDMSGQYPINILDEIVFDVAEDGTLTARTSWLVYSFGGYGNGIENLYNVTTGKKITEEASIAVMPSDVVFPDETVYAGTQAVKIFYCVNTGRKSTVCNYEVHGKGLQLAANPNLNPLIFNAFYVYLTAEKEGEYNGYIDITPEGQEAKRINVRANVLKANDYNSIVKNGNFTFSLTKGDYVYEPWVISEDVADHPVAYATLEEMGSCGLNVDMEVPAGKTGIFSWKGISHTMMPNGFRVILDNADVVYDNIYEWSGYNAPHPADGYVIIPSGKHTVTFEFMLGMDWYGMGFADAPQQAYIWDLDLQTYDEKPELGVLIDRTVDFGTWYLDKFIGGATAEASIVNLGTEKLRIIGGDNSDSFEVVGIGREIESMETLESIISFTGDKVGDYDEVVTVKTNGGDFKVRCLAKAERIITDYQYLVTEGDLSFGTSISHPFTADSENKTAYSSTAKADYNNDSDPDSWLSVSFIVPEGKQGTISWTGNNSSNDLFIFAGVPAFTDGTQIFIDGEKIAEFAGICEASSMDIDESYLTFGPGRHSVKFNYVRNSSTSEGNDDRVVISNIGLNLQNDSAAVNTVSENLLLMSEEYFTLEGYRVVNPENGIFIKKSTYSDGSIKSTKIVIR